MLFVIPPPISIELPLVAVSVLLVCASAGTDVLNIPPMIAKAATTTTSALSVGFIK
jgi:hypothetical protein